KRAPSAYGWCRTRWSCATLAAQLQVQRGVQVSADTLRRWLHPLGWVWKRAKLVARDDDVELFINDFDFDRKRLSEDQSSVSIGSRERLDFRWVLDLEGKEFDKHPPTLKLKPGGLSPIIEFPHGLVFNEELSPKVNRSVGNGQPEPFGRISDAVGIDIDARPSDQLVLRGENGEDIFRIPVEKDRKVRVFINNIPPVAKPPGNKPEPVSHFHMYYDVFENVTTKYDIQPIKETDTQRTTCMKPTSCTRAQRGSRKVDVLTAASAEAGPRCAVSVFWAITSNHWVEPSRNSVYAFCGLTRSR
ncbi:MAG TPA: winged helix-turn-helix domain-containing protein, partial [Blastocatellia bacterium]|nr:winged helix-turn-helix domain-containing protein [Blastocatellia bacterium]